MQQRPSDRVNAKGYIGVSGEVASWSLIGAAGTGVASVRLLLSGPYHRAVLLSGSRDVGIAIRQPSESGSVSAVSATIIDLGYPQGASEQQLGTSGAAIYPCDGTTNESLSVYAETPNPAPDRDPRNPIGSPVMIMVRPGNVAAITSASMTNTFTGQAVVLRAPETSVTDPNKVLAANVSYIAPDTALAANTTYKVVVQYTNNGVSGTMASTFTTGAR